ncbi:hypothetical protein DIPPA_22924 [Diplonema papillatum]|nr:hypothetical protein DIPPA_22924 [Diplonema papillatum]
MMARSGTDRLDSVSKHLKFHPKSPSAAAAAPHVVKHIPRVAAATSWGSSARWVAPPLVAILALTGAWKHQQTRERILAALMKGGMWVLKYQFAVAPASSHRYFIQQCEACTQDHMATTGSTISTLLPLEEYIDTLLRSKEKRALLSAEEKRNKWVDLEVAAFCRIVVGVYCLALTHFASTAVHALSPSGSETMYGSGLRDFVELPLNLDLQLMIRTASAACREALRKRNLHELKAMASMQDIDGVLDEVRHDLSLSLGFEEESTVALHEVVLGEEKSGEVEAEAVPNGGPAAAAKEEEPPLTKKLRDLLEASSPVALLSATLDGFFSVASMHVADAFRSVAADCATQVAMVKFCPRLCSEMSRITEDDNEFLMTLRSGEDCEESSWASFFLDLQALANPQRSVKAPSNKQMDGLLASLANGTQP